MKRKRKCFSRFQTCKSLPIQNSNAGNQPQRGIMAQSCTLCWTLNCNGRFRLIMYHRQDFRQALLHMLYAKTRGTLLFCTSCPNLLLLHAEASHVRSYQLGGSMQQNRRRGSSPVPPWSSFRKERRPSTFLIYMNLGGRMGSDK